MDYVNQLISRSSIVAREEAENEEGQTGITTSNQKEEPVINENVNEPKVEEGQSQSSSDSDDNEEEDSKVQ